MRLSEIVNTVQAYRNLQQAVAGRTVAAAQKNADAANDLLAQLGISQDDSSSADQSQQADSLDLSGAGGAGGQGQSDDPLGAIIEGFYSQRQTYNFTIPGVEGMTSPINVTWEVQKAYHVIQFVPQSQMSQLGQSVDQEA